MELVTQPRGERLLPPPPAVKAAAPAPQPSWKEPCHGGRSSPSRRNAFLSEVPLPRLGKASSGPVDASGRAAGTSAGVLGAEPPATSRGAGGAQPHAEASGGDRPQLDRPSAATAGQLALLSPPHCAQVRRAPVEDGVSQWSEGTAAGARSCLVQVTTKSDSGAQSTLELSGVQQAFPEVGDRPAVELHVATPAAAEPAPAGQGAFPWGQGVARQLGLFAQQLDDAGDVERARYARTQANRLAQCGRKAVMACVRCASEHEESAVMRCESRACGYCAQKRAARALDVGRRVALSLRSTSPGARVFVVTVTTKKPRSPTFRYTDAAYGFLSSRCPRIWAWLKRRGAIGAAGSLETGKLGMVHGHFAVVADWDDCRREALQAEFRDWWRKTTSVDPVLDGTYRVEVALAKGYTRGLPFEEAFALAVKECVAYCVGGSARPGDIERPELFRLAAWTLVALCGRRRIRTYGVFFGVDFGPEEREPGIDDDKPKPDTCVCCGGRAFVVLYLLDPGESRPPSPPAGAPELRGLSPGGGP